MDPVWLARLQFSLTIMFHFLFPPITIGLSLFIAILETLRWRTGHDLYLRASDFWLKILAITFTAGVATGVVMEFEFGTNWAGYSRFVGDVFGAPLAAEAVLAFFLESGFLGLLIFGRKRISSFLRWLSSVLVFLGSALSAFWILVANSWMQTPAGYVVRNGRAELTDFWAAVLNPSTLPRFAHTISSALVCGAFLVVGVSAWHVLEGRRSVVSRFCLKLATALALLGVVLSFATGDRHAKQVARTQPAKFAAMEGLYSTQAGAPMVLLSLPPSQGGPRNGPELTITRLTSFLAFGNFQAPVRGLEDFPDDQRPPVAVTFLSFHNMVILGNLMLLQALAGVFLLWRGKLDASRWWLRMMVFSVPVPMLAIQLGWLAAEAGRQPWIVYGLMRTRDAASRVVTAPQLVFSLALFSVLYLALGALWLMLLRKEVVHGPEEVPSPVFAPLGPEEAVRA